MENYAIIWLNPEEKFCVQGFEFAEEAFAFELELKQADMTTKFVSKAFMRHS